MILETAQSGMKLASLQFGPNLAFRRNLDPR
jgi:hypothetical protein